MLISKILPALTSFPKSTTPAVARKSTVFPFLMGHDSLTSKVQPSCGRERRVTLRIFVDVTMSKNTLNESTRLAVIKKEYIITEKEE